MPVEKSAGAIIFFDQGGKKEYLLLRYAGSTKKAKDYWDFPKGHIEKGETEIETVKREIKEETGLEDIGFISGFKTSIRYFFRKQEKVIFKIVVFYLARAKTKNVKISFEHIGFKWLPYEEALKTVTYKNAKEVLKRAFQYLKRSKTK